MQIDSETLGIPDSDYDARIKLPSNEFKRIASDLSSIGDTITVSVTKDGIKFSTLGDIGNANVLVKQTSSVDDKSKETIIDMKEPVSLGFAARYFNSFAKATPLSDEVTLSIHKVRIATHMYMEMALTLSQQFEISESHYVCSLAGASTTCRISREDGGR